ncbi:hypothetical protein HUJ04_003605 [Dendroctonus ponderosae]|nr:hypothetical protein HUJ04_003605 [Dendroctonus ponderosae]
MGLKLERKSRLRNVKYLKQTINNKIIKDHPDSFHFPYLKNPNQSKVAKESEEGLIEDDDSQSSIAKLRENYPKIENLVMAIVKSMYRLLEDTIILRSTIDISIITIDVLRKAALLMAIHCMKHVTCLYQKRKERKERSKWSSTNVEDLSCGICSKQFPSSVKLKRHLRIHREKKLFCTHCDRKFQMKYLLVQHLKKVHFKECNNFACQYCTKQFAQEERMKRHIDNVHYNQFKYSCSHCDRGFNFKYELLRHEEFKHLGLKLTCNVCSKSFKNEQYFKEHQKTHDPEYKKDEFLCCFCSKILTHVKSYKVHMKSHTGEAVASVCDICGKNLTSKASLRHHMRIHTGEKPFQCDVCGKSFTTTSLLRTHRVVHTKEKPFQCHMCSKSFTQKGSLNIHVRQHTGVKPSCEFVQQDLIELEDNSDNEPIEQYQCGICSEIFSSKIDLIDKHLHEYTKKLTCCKCLQTFSNTDDMCDHHELHKGVDNLDAFYREDHFDGDKLILMSEHQELVEFHPSNEPNMLNSLNQDDENSDLVLPNEGLQVQSNKKSKSGEVTKSPTKTVEMMSTEQGYVLAAGANETFQATTAPKRTYSFSRPRANPLPKRHELPYFWTTKYIVMSPNANLDAIHFKCQRCEQLFINKFGTFMYEKNVKEHMLRHLDQFRHRCEACSKGFYTVREYRNHYKNRHMGIRYVCDVCSRSFADEYYFKRHSDTHKKAQTNLTDLSESR